MHAGLQFLIARKGCEGAWGGRMERGFKEGEGREKL